MATAAAPARGIDAAPSAATGDPQVPTVDDRALGVDASAIVIVSIAICTASHELAWMTLLVPAVIGLRFLAWTRLPRSSRGHGLGVEIGLFAIGLLLGAANDWNSVMRHRIYEYTVPHYWPALTTIPLWMLLYWGMIVRFVISVCRWRRLGPPALPQDRVLGASQPRAWLKVALQLVLLLATRQAIYRLHGHPVWSWLPFVVALVVWLVLLHPTQHDLRLLGLVAIGGPGIEVLYIQVGHLHRYALGWLAGVPLWIALWWLLAIVVLNDLSARLLQWAGPRQRRLTPSAVGRDRQ